MIYVKVNGEGHDGHVANIKGQFQTNRWKPLRHGLPEEHIFFY